MNCDETTALLTDRLQGALAPDADARLDEHLKSCAACRREAEALATLWADLGAEVVVPHERMRARFHAALAAYEERAGGALERLIELIWPRRPALQAALAAGLLVAGVLIGQRLQPSSDVEIAALRAEVRTVGLALFDHQSASERLLGVAWARRVEPEPAVVAALLERVEYDSNLNVRLAAVEALRARLDRPDIRSGLSNALARQDAPLVQIAVADALLDGGGADGVAAVRGMLDREQIEPSVRDYLRAALQPSADGSDRPDI
jgi:putative zinc finger protein